MNEKGLLLPQTLYHITPSINVTRIEREGLLVSESQGAQQVLWFVERGKLNWGILHTAKRNHTFGLTIVTCRVITPLRTAFYGLWISRSDIPPRDTIRYETVQYSDDPDFNILHVDPVDISKHLYNQPCPFCQRDTLTILFDKDGDITYAKCPACKKEPPDQPVEFEE